MTDNDILEEIEKNSELKKKFLDGLNKLGFPLEFKIRRRLKDKGYTGVQEGFFTGKDNGQESTKSYDIHAYKDKKKEILKQLTINLSLQLVGDCKYSSDKGKFLFAIPDTSNPANKLFIGPILTSLQSANYGSYRNSEVASIFIEKYGSVFIASDIKDSSKDHIINGKESKDNKTQEYERIFNIVENTILPPLKEKFLRWRSFAYNDYISQIDGLTRDMSIQDFVNQQENRYYSGKILVPFIVTSKKIISPIVNEKDEIIDLQEVKYLLYEHSVLKPDEYCEILDNYYDIGVFICNEKYFDEFVEYAENIFIKIFDTITENLSKHPFRLIDDFEQMKKHDEDIKRMKESKK